MIVMISLIVIWYLIIGFIMADISEEKDKAMWRLFWPVMLWKQQ